MTWLLNELDMTKLGCPVALPRFSSRPSDSTMIECPSAKAHSSTWGLTLIRCTPGNRVSPAMSISLSKWPMLPTIAWCFIRPMCSAVMTLRQPVAVMKMSAVSTTSSTVATWYPSIAAWSAQIGSTSVTITRAPWPRSDSAQPLPTSPYPQTTATLPPISTSVARLMPSISECRQPYLLSNLLLVTESFTLIAGNSSVSCCCISYSRCTPVVVSSVTPLIAAPTRVHRCPSAASERRSTSRVTAYSSESSSAVDGTAPAASNCAPLCTRSVASPPSSRIMFGPAPSGQSSTCSVHHQYSGSVSPFHAYTGTPAGACGVPSGPTTTAAAAWS